VRAFLDTNILVYAQQSGAKGETAKDIVAKGGIISVQVLNELVSVLRRKLRRSWRDVEDVLDDVTSVLEPALPLTVQSHVAALGIAREDGLSFCDALIVASALEAGCDTLYSEDLQHGRAFAGLTIHNPFLPRAAD
jgi:predicted nucleic acid-binding protein